MADWYTPVRSPLLRWCGAEFMRERLNSVLPDASVVVDVGCGRGVTYPPQVRHYIRPDDYAAHRRRGGIILGLDVDPQAATNPYVDRFVLVRPDRPWPIDSGMADVVLCDGVLEHVDAPALFVGECFRVLRPGGAFIARTLQKWSIAGIGGRLVPNRFHAQLTQMLRPNTREDDVFPTRMRLNTKAAIASTFKEAGFRGEIRLADGLDMYGARWRWLEKTAQRVEDMLPRSMAQTVIIDARKPSL